MIPGDERTLVILKPDAVARGLIGEILSRFEKRYLHIRDMKMMQHIDGELAHEHYREHNGKPFYPGLIQAIMAGPVVVLVIEGLNAVMVVRHMIGATDPLWAAQGTIRGDMALGVPNNLIHGSDSPESAKREIELFYPTQSGYGVDEPQYMGF